MSEPKIKIYNTAYNNIRVKVNFDKEDFNYYQGQKQYIRKNTTKDKEKYPYIIENYNYLNDFLRANGINSEKVAIDEDSTKSFYVFENHFHGELTKDIADEWWNLDCPNLYKYLVNVDRNKNWAGLNLICFENLLIEMTIYNVYINKTVEEKEITKLTAGRENTMLYKEWVSVKKAKDESKVKEAEKKVKEYEKRIQNVIDNHEDEILKKFDGELYEITDDGIKPGMFGLDLGFLNIYTENNEISEAKKILYNFDNNQYFKWLKIKLPYEPQSTTIKRKIFYVVKRIVKEKLGEDLYCQVVLD
ncbi:MAG: hypothetical protein ACOCT9_00350 [archaeon]